MNNERIKAKLVSKPAWAREFQVDIDDPEADAGYQQILARWAEIATTLHERIEDFFNDPDRAFLRADEGFPLRERLTGEYYVGDSWCIRNELQGRPACYCGVMFRCLEHPQHGIQQDRDYLGLEAGIYLWLDTGEIELEDGFNTSSI